MTVTAELDMSRLALEIAVDQLTRGDAVRIERDDRTETARTAPLLVQVEQAVSDTSGPAGAFVARSKPPLRVEAVDLLREVDCEVRWYRRSSRLERVRAWSAAMHGLTDHDALTSAMDCAEGWVRKARGLLDPTPPWALRGKACPQCGATEVEVTDGCGELVMRPPLEIDRISGTARCVAPGCDLRVNPEGWEHLAEQIDKQTRIEHEQHEEEPWEAA